MRMDFAPGMSGATPMKGNDQISEESIRQENAKQANRQEVPAIRSVGIVSRPRRIDVDCVVPPLLDWLAQRGITAVLDRETAACLPAGNPGQPREELPSTTDML